MATKDTPIVIDNGSSFLRVGIATENEPSFILPTLTGNLQKDFKSIFFKDNNFIGDEVQKRRGILDLKPCVKDGVVVNWDGLCSLWQQAFDSIQHTYDIYYEDVPIMVHEPPGAPQSNRKELIEQLLETFQCHSMFISFGTQAVHAAGRNSGLILNIGEGASFALPIYQDTLIEKGIARFSVAGQDITQYFTRLLTEQNCYLRKRNEFEIAKDIKEKSAFVSNNFIADLKQLKTDPNHFKQKYVMPDGRELSLNSERFRAPEIIFRPNMLAREAKGLGQFVYDQIWKCDIDTRSSLLSNIIITGGTTLMPGFASRLESEVKSALADERNSTNLLISSIKVTELDNRQDLIWQGCATLASLGSFQHWVDKISYEESGLAIFNTQI
eukprot:TRINITY_DN6160_c1_g2_i1.p1 TRINITY_DN6160_c1_g2~~TRINITY_DN6160_c1_g2_i1.p1  ORF type:complete len:384 (-),score=179.72 TRINITY_DN6160_c1_g2_i1:73-1224(-)